MHNIPIDITKRFTFEASHRLENYKGKCNRYHGHSYVLEVTVRGVPNKQGLVMDFGELGKLVNEVIIEKCDHWNLNKTMPLVYSMRDNTTCENMLVAFWWALDHLILENYDGVVLQRLRLWETADNYAELTREMVYNDSQN